MKKGKLLILLVAVLSLTVLFIACDQTQPEAPSETGTQGETVESTEEGTIAEIFDEQETAKHEIHNYFDLVVEEDELPFEQISRLDGEIVSVDSEHNLAVISTKDLDNDNMVHETVTVYDLLTGEAILTKSVSNAYMAKEDDKTVLDVSIEYPVIRVCYTSCEEDGGYYDYSYEVSYYQAKKDGECIHTTTDNSFSYSYFDNGLVCFEMGDRVVWIDGDMDVIRTVESVVANGYDVNGFNSEYKGYLYSWNEEELLIFNRSGVVSGKYLAGNDSTISVNVLNNGNALIQEFTEVGIYDSCDFVLEGVRYVMKSSIMNFITGELTEIDLDMVVSEVVTRYEQESNEENSLVLINDSENYGYVYKVANGKISVRAELCVLDNELNVIFTLKNDTVGVCLEAGITPMNDSLYTAVVLSGKVAHAEIFDLDGNSISHFFSALGLTSSVNATVTDKYIVTEETIYDYRLNPLYSIVDNGYVYLGVENDNIYLQKRNFETGAVEIYVITPESSAPELFVDGVDYKFYDVGEGYYVLLDIENEVYRLYNTEGVELLVSHEYLYVSDASDDGLLVATTFGGEDVVYVIK